MKKSMTIKASQQNVWDAIISYRNSDPSKRKVISSGDSKAVVEEKFPGLPLVGSSRVVYEEHETPIARIEYKLVESDKLSKFEGSWSLTETADGKSTEVELSANLESPLPLPFKEQFLNSQASQDMDRRLDYVKQRAEGR